MEELITLCDETVGNVMKLENQVNLEFRVSDASIFVLLQLHIITIPIILINKLNSYLRLKLKKCA